MHILVAVDTFPENHELFIKWLRQRALQYPAVYGDHGLNMKPREIRLYDIICPQSLEKEVISDLKHFEHSKLREIKKVIKFAKKLLRGKFPLEMIDETIEPKTMAEIGNRVIDGKGWFAHTTILGKVKDNIHAEKRHEEI